MNISLTEDLKSFVDARVKARGYSSYSEYVRDLVRRDEEQAKADRFRKLIQEGLESPLLPEHFEIDAHLRARVEERGARRRKSGER